MKVIHVTDAFSYDIIIGDHLIDNIGSHIIQITKPRKAILVSDPTVWALYGSTATGSLASLGFNVIDYIIPSGEQGKSGENYLKLLSYLAENHLQNNDLVVALGGGIICDLCGFAVATYSKNITYIQVPTTLSSMINSSISCKANINLTNRRNLATTTCSPKLVLCDISALSSIISTHFSDSCAEIIKYAIHFDVDLFEHINQHKTEFDREYVVSRCIHLHQNIHQKAETNLQLGHTVCDAIEIAENYAISHGKALSLGIAAACRASEKLGICTINTVDTVIQTNYRLVLPKEIGDCIIYSTDLYGLRSFIDHGL